MTDAACRGLYVNVGKNSKVYYLKYLDGLGRQGKIKLGDATALTVAQAREKAVELKGKLARGESVRKEKPIKPPKLGDFISNEYEPWAKKKYKSADKTLKMLRSSFAHLLPKYLDAITKYDIEKWQEKKLEAELKNATINRCVAGLSGVFSCAVKKGFLMSNPLQGRDHLPEYDSDPRDRDLDRDNGD